MTQRRSLLVGCGAFLPDRVVTNEELSLHLDTSHDWIVKRTGIHQRHIVDDGQMTSDLAIAAARAALDAAAVPADAVDLVIVATTTPDNTFPATATQVQAGLGITRGAAFDVQAVCAGFVFALAVADNFIKVGQFHTAIVIGAETFSRILDWQDRATCVLFGDGAGAVVLTAGDGVGRVTDHGILSTHLRSDGRERDILYVDGGPSSTGTVGNVRMVGKEVYRHAIVKLGSVIDEALAANGLSAADIDWLVPHQANRRILDSIANRLQLPAGKVVCCIDRHANTSAASIPLALNDAVMDGRITSGNLVLFEAIGGGLTWGAGLVRMGSADT